MTEWEKFERMVSLKSETIELGIMSDIESSVAKANKELGTLKGAYMDLKDKLKSIKSEAQKLNSVKDELKKNKDKANAQAKDLGVDISGMKQISDVDFYTDEIDLFLRAISKAII